MHSHPRARFSRPSVARLVALSLEEGAGKAGHRLMPVARLRKKCRRQEPQVQPDDPAFPARWRYGLYVISPGTGFLAPVASALVVTCCAYLISAPGDQDHTISPCASDRSSA